MRGRYQFLILFFISVICLLSVITKTVSGFDEGLILAGADRIQKGQIPFNDFWLIYPPGQYYILALLFDVFGSSLLVERIYDLLIKAMLSVSIFYLIRKMTSNFKVALTGWIISLIWIAGTSYVIYPIYPSILLIYIGVYYFLCYIEKNDLSSLVYSAVFITCSALFRHDLAAYAAISILVCLLLTFASQKKFIWSIIVCYVTSYLIIGIPIIVFILVKINLYEMVDQLIFIPIRIMSKFRYIPYPELSIVYFSFYAFPAIVIVAFISSMICIFKYKERTLLNYGILLISLIGFGFFNQVRVRSELAHLVPIALNGIILISILGYIIHRKFISNKKWIFLTIYFLIVFAILLVPMVKLFKSNHSEFITSTKRSSIPKAEYFILQDDLEKTVRYVRKFTDQSDFIYVGVKNHDQFIINHPIIYYLADRNYSTKFHQFDPGVSNTIDAQKHIVQELETTSPNIVVLTSGYWFEPNDTKFDMKIDIIDTYIKKNYKLHKIFGCYEVWNKRSVANYDNEEVSVGDLKLEDVPELDCNKYF